MEEFINSMFESQLAWFYDNGIIYLNGRDVVAFIAGACAGITLCLLFMLLKESKQ